MVIDGAELATGFNQELKCIQLGSFSKKTKSFSVYHKKTGDAIGKWVNVGTATGSYTFSIQYGLTTTHE